MFFVLPWRLRISLFRSFLLSFPKSAVHWISLPPVPSVFSPLRSLPLHLCHLCYLFVSIFLCFPTVLAICSVEAAVQNVFCKLEEKFLCQGQPFVKYIVERVGYNVLTLLLGCNRRFLGNCVSGVSSDLSLTRESASGFLISNWNGVIQVGRIHCQCGGEFFGTSEKMGVPVLSSDHGSFWWKIGMKWSRLR